MTDKKKPTETDPAQSERFRKAVQSLKDAGELSPTADADFESAIRKVSDAKPSSEQA